LVTALNVNGSLVNLLDLELLNMKWSQVWLVMVSSVVTWLQFSQSRQLWMVVQFFANNHVQSVMWFPGGRGGNRGTGVPREQQQQQHQPHQQHSMASQSGSGMLLVCYTPQLTTYYYMFQIPFLCIHI